MFHRIVRIATATVALSIAWAQEGERDVRALRPADTTRAETAVLDNLERRAREALAAIPHARTGGEADQARPWLRRRLEQSLGFRQLPWPPDLKPQLTGIVKRPGYRIEKIVYQTLPGVQVPAHVYMPEPLSGRAPAILFYNGHWWAPGKAKEDFQAFCINMARLGFVVLSFDAFGQGERGVSNRDHRRTESLLTGISQQGFAEYETQCALSYLLARPEVDPDRIGMTGASGGGYNTWITAAMDDRIKVVVPVVGTSEFYEQLSACRPLDWYNANEHCHFVAGLIRYANNHELLAMAAPRPLLIIAADHDESFPVTGVRGVAEYGQALYRSYGAGEKFSYFEDSSEGHGYQQKKREAAYGWFLRWLQNRGDGKPYAEPPTGTLPPDSSELRCFPAGKNQPAGPGMHAAIERLANAAHAPVLPVAAETAAPAPRLRNVKLQRLEISTEPGLTAPAFLLRPDGAERGILVAVDDRGKEELASDPVIRHAREQGWAICGVDPRGIGESTLRKTGWVFAVSLLLGENFVERQGSDIARVAASLKASGIYARGHNAALAAAYAVARGPSTLRWFILRDGFVSFHQFIDRPESMRASYALQAVDPPEGGTYDREIPSHYFPFGALRTFDIPDLLAASPARRGLVVNPIDGDWKRMPAAGARKLLPANVEVVSGADPLPRVAQFLDQVQRQ
ncbi:MAG TPA: prolyl oligopeptidase family serine peptidase [Bryobacteraceae bacterium]